MALRCVLLATTVTVAALAFSSITAFSRASSPPLPGNALFQSVTPSNIEEIRNRLNGSPNSRNQIPVGTVLVYKTSAGHRGKLQIVKWGSRLHTPDYDLYVKFVTYKADGSILTQRDNFWIKGTWVYDLDTGKAIRTLKNPAADLFWEIGSPTQAYLDFQNGASFTIVT